jgi:WD40 repeat protein
VWTVAYSPNGQHIISGSSDKTIRIWDAETGAAIGTPLEGHTASVGSVAYSPNGRHIISGSGDNTIRIWDADTGAAVGNPLKGHTGMCGLLHTLPMGGISSPDPLTEPFESGMPRLVLQLAGL